MRIRFFKGETLKVALCNSFCCGTLTFMKSPNRIGFDTNESGSTETPKCLPAKLKSSG